MQAGTDGPERLDAALVYWQGTLVFVCMKWFTQSDAKSLADRGRVRDRVQPGSSYVCADRRQEVRGEGWVMGLDRISEKAEGGLLDRIR